MGAAERSCGPYRFLSSTLTGYAYETIAGKSIKAGQTKEAADESGKRRF